MKKFLCVVTIVALAAASAQTITPWVGGGTISDPYTTGDDPNGPNEEWHISGLNSRVTLAANTTLTLAGWLRAIGSGGDGIIQFNNGATINSTAASGLRTIFADQFDVANGASLIFTGENSISLDGNIFNTVASGTITFRNELTDGAVLTLGTTGSTINSQNINFYGPSTSVTEGGQKTYLAGSLVSGGQVTIGSGGNFWRGVELRFQSTDNKIGSLFLDSNNWSNGSVYVAIDKGADVEVSGQTHLGRESHLEILGKLVTGTFVTANEGRLTLGDAAEINVKNGNFTYNATVAAGALVFVGDGMGGGSKIVVEDGDFFATRGFYLASGTTLDVSGVAEFRSNVTMEAGSTFAASTVRIGAATNLSLGEAAVWNSNIELNNNLTVNSAHSLAFTGSVISTAGRTITNNITGLDAHGQRNALTLGGREAVYDEDDGSLISAAGIISLNGDTTFNGGGKTIFAGAYTNSSGRTILSGADTELEFKAAKNSVSRFEVQSGTIVTIGEGAEVLASGENAVWNMSVASSTVNLDGKLVVEQKNANGGTALSVSGTGIINMGANAVIEVKDGHLSYVPAWTIGDNARVAVSNGNFSSGALTLNDTATISVADGIFSYGTSLTMNDASRVEVTGARGRADLAGTVTIGAGATLVAPTIRFANNTNLSVGNAKVWNSNVELNGTAIFSGGNSIEFTGNVYNVQEGDKTITNNLGSFATVEDERVYTGGTLTLGSAGKTIDSRFYYYDAVDEAFKFGAARTFTFNGTGRTVLAGALVGNGNVNINGGVELNFHAAGNQIGRTDMNNAGTRVVIAQEADVTVTSTATDFGLIARGGTALDVLGKLTVNQTGATTWGALRIDGALTTGVGSEINVSGGDFFYNFNALLTLANNAKINVVNGNFILNQGSLTMNDGSKLSVTNGVAELRNSVTLGIGAQLTAPTIRVANNTTLTIADTTVWNSDVILNGNLTFNKYAANSTNSITIAGNITSSASRIIYNNLGGVLTLGGTGTTFDTNDQAIEFRGDNNEIVLAGKLLAGNVVVRAIGEGPVVVGTGGAILRFGEQGNRIGMLTMNAVHGWNNQFASTVIIDPGVDVVASGNVNINDNALRILAGGSLSTEGSYSSTGSSQLSLENATIAARNGFSIAGTINATGNAYFNTNPLSGASAKANVALGNNSTINSRGAAAVVHADFSVTGNNTTYHFGGTHDLWINGDITSTDQTRKVFSNNIAQGAVLELGYVGGVLAPISSGTYHVANDYFWAFTGSGYTRVLSDIVVSDDVTLGGMSDNLLRYHGSGTLELAGTNNYKGDTVVNNATGTLVFSGKDRKIEGEGGAITIEKNQIGSLHVWLGNAEIAEGAELTSTAYAGFSTWHANSQFTLVMVGGSRGGVTQGGLKTLNINGTLRAIGSEVVTDVVGVNGAGNQLNIGEKGHLVVTGNTFVNGGAEMNVRGEFTNTEAGNTVSIGAGNSTARLTLYENAKFTSKGALTVSNGGTVVWLKDEALLDAPVFNFTGGTFQATGNARVGTWVGAGEEREFINGTITINNNVTFASVDAAATIFADLDLTGGNSTFFFDGTNNLSIHGDIKNTGDNNKTFTNRLASYDLETGAVTNRYMLTLGYEGGTLLINDHAGTGRALTFNGDGNTTVLSDIENGRQTGTLTHSGTGLLELAGKNTYTGTTTVNGGGTLRFTNTGNTLAAFSVTNRSIMEIAANAAVTSTGNTTVDNFGHLKVLENGFLEMEGTLTASNSARVTVGKDAILNVGTTVARDALFNVSTSAYINGTMNVTGTLNSYGTYFRTAGIIPDAETDAKAYADFLAANRDLYREIGGVGKFYDLVTGSDANITIGSIGSQWFTLESSAYLDGKINALSTNGNWIRGGADVVVAGEVKVINLQMAQSDGAASNPFRLDKSFLRVIEGGSYSTRDDVTVGGHANAYGSRVTVDYGGSFTVGRDANFNQGSGLTNDGSMNVTRDLKVTSRQSDILDIVDFKTGSLSDTFVGGNFSLLPGVNGTARASIAGTMEVRGSTTFGTNADQNAIVALENDAIYKSVDTMTVSTGSTLWMKNNSKIVSNNNIVANGNLEVTGAAYVYKADETTRGAINFVNGNTITSKADGKFGHAILNADLNMNYGTIDSVNTFLGNSHLTVAGVLSSSSAGTYTRTMVNALDAGKTLAFTDILIGSSDSTFTFATATGNDGGTTIITGTITGTANGGNVQFGSEKSGQDGAGIYILTGDNSDENIVYQGTTTIMSGSTLYVNNDYSGAKGEVIVQKGATLGGTHTIGAATTILSGGVLNQRGATFSNGLTFKQDAKILVSGITSDHISGGTLSFEQSITLVLSGSAEDWSFELGLSSDKYLTLFTYTPGVDASDFMARFSVDGVTIGDLDDVWVTFADGLFEGGYHLVNDTETGRIYINGLVAVPEPSTWLLLGIGATILVIFRRRRKA